MVPKLWTATFYFSRCYINLCISNINYIMSSIITAMRDPVTLTHKFKTDFLTISIISTEHQHHNVTYYHTDTDILTFTNSTDIYRLRIRKVGESLTELSHNK